MIERHRAIARCLRMRSRRGHRHEGKQAGEEEGDRVLRTAFASDMMSDVLACVTEDTLLLTGLVNGQCVRTCEMLDVPCVVFVRSKEPLADALALAREIDLPMLKTPYTMFEACARLYTAGLRPVELG